MDCGICHQNFEVLKWKKKLHVLSDDMGNIVLFSCGRTFHYFCLMEIFCECDGKIIKCPECSEDHLWNSMVTIHKHQDSGFYSQQAVVLQKYEDELLKLTSNITQFKTTYFGKLSYGERGCWVKTESPMSNCINCGSDEHYLEACKHGFYLSDAIPCQNIMDGSKVMVVRYIPTGPKKSAAIILATLLSDFKKHYGWFRVYLGDPRLVSMMIKSFLSILYYEELCRRCGSPFHDMYKCSEDALDTIPNAKLGMFQDFCSQRYSSENMEYGDYCTFTGY